MGLRMGNVRAVQYEAQDHHAFRLLGVHDDITEANTEALEKQAPNPTVGVPVFWKHVRPR